MSRDAAGKTKSFLASDNAKIRQKKDPEKEKTFRGMNGGKVKIRVKNGVKKRRVKALSSPIFPRIG
jgi:hypothetical protein